MRRTLLTLVAPLLLLSHAFGQPDERTLLQQGLRLEGADQYEAAIAVYEQILKRNPRNVNAIYRLAGVYAKVNRFDPAIALLQRRIQNAPGDITALNRLSNVYLAAGNQNEADRQINRILELSRTEGAYLSVGQRYERLNQDDKAETVYLRGRRDLKSPNLFARELAQIYERAENGSPAVREYLTLAADKPQYVALVEDKLERIVASAPEPRTLVQPILETVKGSHRDSRIMRIYVSAAIAAGLASDALNEILLLPPDARIEGGLLRIGKNLIDSGDAGDAIRAFEALTKRTGNRVLRSQASAGIARSLDILERNDEALTEYRNVFSSAGPDEVRAEAAHRHADLLRRVGHVDSALTSLSDWIQTSSRSAWRARSVDLVAAMHLTQGRTDKAAGWYTKNINENRGKEPALVSTYRLAQLHTMTRDYPAAQKALARILNSGLASTVYNDALDLIDLIETGLGEDQAGLDRFAEGLRLEGRGSLRSAAVKYLEPGPGALSDRVARRGIEILMSESSWTEAEAALTEMIGRKSDLASWAVYTLAQTIENQDRTDEAIRLYESILVDYPLSLEADRSRDRLAELRATPEAG